MAALPTPEPLAFRHASCIQELRDFFSTYGLHCGSPEDILTLTRMLRQPGPFAGDLSLVIRSILFREGSSFSRARLLEIVALAIGGPEMDCAPRRLGPAFTELFAFLASIRARPLTQSPSPLPGQPSRSSQLVPFPPEGLVNRSAAQAAVTAEADQLPLRQPQSSQPQSLSSTELPSPQPEPAVPASRTARKLLIAGTLLLLLAWILALLLRPHFPIQAASRSAAASVAAVGQPSPAAQAASSAQAGSRAHTVPPSPGPLKPSPYVYSVTPTAHRRHPATPQPVSDPAQPSQ